MRSSITTSITRQNQGFTLLELLVVMAILALLVGLGLRTFGSIQQKSRDTKRKQDLASISKTLELYYNDFGHYPLSDNGQMLACGEAAAEACVFGDVWQDSSNSTLYMSKLPQDPGGGQYYYLADELGRQYQLFAYLENSEDVDVVLGLDQQPGFYSGTACRIVDYVLENDSCNYMVRSSNVVTTPTIVGQ
jgi:general secretion pathway protein G